ncbi:MAG TPA: zinc-ribbon domain-containing protein, partial [Shinella sp.]|nr:zinc-ribbon domain-containing protein [Shinella sp.]
MKLFTCATCGQTIHFDNRVCVRCGSTLGFLAEDTALHALVPEGEGFWRIAPGEGVYRFCDNAVHDVCNWLLPADSPHAFCQACRHNRIVPATDPAGLERW